MSRSWPSEWRGGLTATAGGLAVAVGIGLLERHNPVSLILTNLQMHAALGLVLTGIALFVLRARWRGLAVFLAGAAVMVGVAMSLAPYSVMPTGGKGDIDVISFNLFGPNTANGGRIADYLAGSGADVIVIVESAPIVPFLERLAKTYPYQAGCADVGAECGDVLIVSKYPLENTRLLALVPDSPHQTIVTDVVMDDSRVQLVALQLRRTDYGSLQVAEMQKLAGLLRQTEGPAILAGDFNSAPWPKPMLHVLKAGGFSRATIEPGTWPVELGPLALPIDHIFVSSPARFATLDVLPDSFGSNHRGLRAEIALGGAE